MNSRTHRKLERISNGLQAANKIINIGSSMTRNDSGSGAPSLDVSTLSSVVRSIAAHSPEAHRTNLEQTLDRCSQYCNTYRELKRHFMQSGSRESGGSGGSIIKALNLAKPVVNGRQRKFIEKLLGIYSILNS